MRAILWAMVMVCWTVATPMVALGQDYDGTLHPVDRLVREIGPGPTSVSRAEEPADHLVTEWRRIESFPEALRIGQLDGPLEETFGEITDVIVRDDGAILVLDGLASAVRVFDSNGEFLETVGGSGRGPGEFMSPVGIAVDSDHQRLLVVDITRSLSVFERDGEEYEFVTRASLPAAPNDVCAGAGGMAVSLLPSDLSAPLQLMDDNLAVQHSIPPAYLSDNPAIQRASNGGRLACSEGDAVLFAPDVLSLVRAFDLGNGNVSWTARFEDYSPNELWETETGMASRTTEQGTNTFLSLVPFADAILVQVAGQTAQGHERRLPYVSIDTYLIDGRTGDGGYIGSDIGEVGVIGEDYWIEVQRLPFPQLVVHRDTESGGGA